MLGIEELYRRYRDDVYRYLVALTHDPTLAEDLLSETFLCAVQKAGTFRGQSSEKIWLFGIARNLWLQSLRKEPPHGGVQRPAGGVRGGPGGEGLRLPPAGRAGGSNCWMPCRNGSAPSCSCAPGACPMRRSPPAAASGQGSARVIEYRVRQSLKETLRKEGYL